MKIGIDLRSLQDKTSRGASSYAIPLIEEITRQASADPFVGFISGRYPAPAFKFPTKKIDLPSKVTNASLALLNYPKIDRLLGTETVWMPNWTFWSFSKTARVVLTVHDLSFMVDPSWYSAKDRLWHRIIGAKKLIARADKLLTLSEHTAGELTELMRVPAEKISVIPPGVPPILNSNNKLFEFPYILFIGVVEPRKNIETALAAFLILAQKNKDIHFVLAGPKPTTYNPQPATAHDRVHFLGQVTPEQKGSLLRNAQALFFPSHYEGFGFPALEAMSVGVPVVATAAGALPEVVGNAGVLLDPRDAGAFAETLDQVLRDNALRTTLITRGNERAKDFSWEKCAAETLKIIRD